MGGMGFVGQEDDMMMGPQEGMMGLQEAMMPQEGAMLGQQESLGGQEGMVEEYGPDDGLFASHCRSSIGISGCPTTTTGPPGECTAGWDNGGPWGVCGLRRIRTPSAHSHITPTIWILN